MKKFDIGNSSLSILIKEGTDKTQTSIAVYDSYAREELEIPLDVVGV